MPCNTGARRILGRLHEAAMEGRGDMQHHRPLGATFLGQRNGPLDRRRRSGDHGLFRSVHIGWLDRRTHLPRGILANGDHGPGCMPRMAAMAPWPAGTACCINCPRRRTVRAARQTRSRRRRRWRSTRRANGRQNNPRLRQPRQNAQRRDGRGKDGRLGELSQPQLLFGSVKTELRQVEAESVIGFLEVRRAIGKAAARSRPMPTLWEP